MTYDSWKTTEPEPDYVPDEDPPCEVESDIDGNVAHHMAALVGHANALGLHATITIRITSPDGSVVDVTKQSEMARRGEVSEEPLCTCADRGDPRWNGKHEIGCPWLRWKLCSNEVVVFTEGEFQGVSRRPTREEADAYACGVMDGAGFYGAGSCTAYVMPYEADEMRREEDADEVQRALSALDAFRAERDA